MTDDPALAAVRDVLNRAEPVSLPEGAKWVDRPRDRRELEARDDSARQLVAAIRATHPNDARPILAAALVELLPETIDGRREDAAYWSGKRSQSLPGLAEVLGKLRSREHRRAQLDGLFRHLTRHPAFGRDPARG